MHPQAPALSAGYADDGEPVPETIPGNFMMWIFIIGDVLVFSGLLVGFCVAKWLDHSAFLAAQVQLVPSIAALETVTLILSGWLAAIAVEHQRQQRNTGLPLAGAMAFGALFLLLKVREYAHSAALFDYETGFAQLYYLITGFHALHVGLGLTLFALSFRRSQKQYLPDYARYWHFTDLIWLMIFPLLYVIR
ncbi:MULTISPECIES: cytochrome c oxidase subunit 3 [unclassified Azospirillum]|uniref:cytochrome c oxidase subunit 3 n=1 Tax=unclassified Azospirillum TaxID=2630922 RepID=UPI000B6287AC|nr:MULTISPECIES: cytochrome c oxidase subunit 3 [unclassified Azospirillum]SNS13210.1 nitric oxide reductase NorE protein [Azospirillum sp. RU38E]SNS30288.1 nitric oxide reductase NorE protein [Azospirillum sp. RU37A]